MPDAGFITEWKTGEPLTKAKVRVKDVLAKHAPGAPVIGPRLLVPWTWAPAAPSKQASAPRPRYRATRTKRTRDQAPPPHTDERGAAEGRGPADEGVLGEAAGKGNEGEADLSRS